MTDEASEQRTKALKKHLGTPEISISQHVRARQMTFAEKLLKRKRVYLDTNHWIFLREAALGFAISDSDRALLVSLRRLVQTGLVVCPISESVFMELLRQKDLATRRKTAELMDELSLGACLMPVPSRLATEIAHYLHSQGGLDCYPMETLVWTKLSNVFDPIHPVSNVHSPELMLAIQKAFFDETWDTSLVEIVDRIGEAEPPRENYEALAERLNTANAVHAGLHKSFPQVYRAEVRGYLSTAMYSAREVLERMADENSGATIGGIDAEKRQEEAQLLDYFCKVIRERSVAIALRTAHIGALCHAAVRWDEMRRLEANDFLDFHHAEAAVGYCDVFLTEKSLRTMLTQGHLKLAKNFPCTVIASTEEAIAYLFRLET